MNRFDRLAVKAAGKSTEAGWVRAYAAFRSDNHAELARELNVDKATVSRWAATEQMRLYVRSGCMSQPAHSRREWIAESRRVRHALNPAHYSALTTLFRRYEFSPQLAFGFLIDAAQAEMNVRRFAAEMRMRLNGDPGDLWHDYRKYVAGLREWADRVLMSPVEFRDDARVLSDALRDFANQVRERISE